MNRLKSKQTKVVYENQYKIAFKEATNLIAERTAEPVGAMCQRLYKAFDLDGKKRLAWSTAYRAYKDGIAGTSPKKKGPAPKIQHEFLESVATHAEVCQVGDGKLRGKDSRQLIGASIVGTVHANLYKAESVWRKVRTKFRESLQAATKIAVEDAQAQWTTHNNLNQLFDNVKKDLLATGLVENEIVYGKDRELVSEVRFKMHSEC